MNSSVSLNRKTKETDIRLTLDFLDNREISIHTTLPFFDHLLEAMSFHGNFSLAIKAQGDTQVDPHHLIEDTGLVLGECLFKYSETTRLKRFGHSVIPMDESLAEVVVDVCGRPTLVYQADFPQVNAGTFDLALIREFLIALSSRAKLALHASCRRGENGHHMAEALFKALGKALKQAYEIDKELLSTKGTFV